MEIYDDPDDMWGFFCQIVTSCLNTYIPLKKVSGKYSKRPTPWMTPEIVLQLKRSRGQKVLLSTQETVRILLCISDLRIS